MGEMIGFDELSVLIKTEEDAQRFLDECKRWYEERLGEYPISDDENTTDE